MLRFTQAGLFKISILISIFVINENTVTFIETDMTIFEKSFFHSFTETEIKHLGFLGSVKNFENKYFLESS